MPVSWHRCLHLVCRHNATSSQRGRAARSVRRRSLPACKALSAIHLECHQLGMLHQVSAHKGACSVGNIQVSHACARIDYRQCIFCSWSFESPTRIWTQSLDYWPLHTAGPTTAWRNRGPLCQLQVALQSFDLFQP